jgi:hypothetical protein
MTDPRNTDPRYDDPYPGPNLNDRSGGSTWAWIAGIIVVVLVAFLLAAIWNGNPQTASRAPTVTTGMGTTAMHPTPPPATTGQSPGAPAIAPNTMTPQTTPTTK